MDPESFSLGVTVAALAAKAIDAGGDRLVGAAAGAVDRLVDRLRGWFRDHSDDDGKAALVGVEEVPDSPKRLTALADAVDRWADDDGFRRELEQLVAAAESAGVDVEAVSQGSVGVPDRADPARGGFADRCEYRGTATRQARSLTSSGVCRGQ